MTQLTRSIAKDVGRTSLRLSEPVPVGHANLSVGVDL
jgi:hypothetical protein